MGEAAFGLTEAVAMALGGMIGGGIYAVLGVVTGIAGAATWFAFGLAGVVALGAGYSYNALNALDEENRGGSVTFMQSFVGSSTLAGMAGWTILVGYVGSMAMYAFAFGEFATAFGAVPGGVAGLPLRPVLSVLVVAGFVGVNLLGARATGRAETVLVAAKVAVLVALGAGGVGYALAVSPDPMRLGGSAVASFGPVMAAAVSFVAFQGWQLLFYDQARIDDPGTTIPRAVYLAIPVAVTIYALVAVATVNLAPAALETDPHTALAEAARAVLAGAGLGGLGFTVISLSALVSTSSAINATLFSTGYFAKGMLADDLLPDRVGDASAEGVPTRTLVGLGAITAAIAAYGSLAAITAFASLAFIVVFGGVSTLAFARRHHPGVRALPPAVGAVGSLGFLPLMLTHLYRAEPGTFRVVVIIAVAVVGLELLYFERDVLEREVERFEAELNDIT